MGSKSKKGAQLERQIVKDLSLWWTNDDRDDIFYRTAGSGARATTRAKQGIRTTNSCGDVGYLDRIGKILIDFLNIEIKRGYNKDLSIMDLVDGLQKKNPLLPQWIDKGEEEAIASGRRYLIIIMRRDYRDECIAMPIQLMGELENYVGRFEPEFGYEITIARTNKPTYIIISFSDFKRVFNRGAFESVAEQYGYNND